jgi:N-acetylglutamate synthase-like GNAT family acetyltransferase/anti-sigma regulatory factor (Ser/Thr protein kinase)
VSSGYPAAETRARVSVQRAGDDLGAGALSRVRVTVPSDASALPLVDSIVLAFGETSGLSADDTQALRALTEGLVRFTLEHAYPDQPWGEVEVTLDAADGLGHVDVHDWGLPLTSAGGDLGPLPPPLAALAEEAEDLRLINLGAQGKRLTGRLRLPSATGPAPSHHLDAAPRRVSGAADPGAIPEVREATPEDGEGIAQLLYENYQLSYVHPDFYRPRYLIAELEAKRLLSAVAVHDGQIVGHHALMRAEAASSAETGAAVVHSAYRGLGLFGRLSRMTVERARRLGLAAIYGDAVTIHPFSQRAERAHDYRESALVLGMVPAQVTMRELGPDEPARRTAVLRSYLIFDESPRAVELPTAYRRQLELIYEHVGLTPASRGQVPGDREIVATDEDRARGLAFLRVCGWQEGAHEELTHAVRLLLSRHADVVYADVDLNGVADVDAAVSFLNELGFFLAGLVVHGPERHDHIRLQRLNTEAVEFEAIVCDSPFAQEIKAQVFEDKLRVDPS